MIRLRVWWERRSAHLIFCAAITIGLFVVFESGLGRRNLLLPMLFRCDAAVAAGFASRSCAAASVFIFLRSAFYEFAIVIFGTLGALAFVTFQLRSRIAAIAFLWTILSVAFFLADPVHRPDWLVMMIVPAALMGAAMIDRIHSQRRVAHPQATRSRASLCSRSMCNSPPTSSIRARPLARHRGRITCCFTGPIPRPR